jgi:hypothetical protein
MGKIWQSIVIRSLSQNKNYTDEIKADDMSRGMQNARELRSIGNKLNSEKQKERDGQ